MTFLASLATIAAFVGCEPLAYIAALLPATTTESASPGPVISPSPTSSPSPTPVITTSTPHHTPSETPPTSQNCGGPSWQVNWWAVEVCSIMSSDGKLVSGHLTIRCYQGGQKTEPCQEIRIAEVEMFVDGLKLAKWTGGAFQQAGLTTGKATYPCAAGKSYFIKGMDMAVRGPDGTWTDTKTIGPKLTFTC